MPKAIVVEDSQLAHAVKVARVSSAENGTRDAALLLCLFGTGLKPGELSGLLVSDYLNADGTVRADSELRAEIAFNGRSRPLHWVNAKLTSAINEHLAERFTLGHGVTNRQSAYRGLDPQSSLFVSGRTGEPLRLTRIDTDGVVTYRAEQISALIRKLFRQAGIEGASAQSGRRTMAVKLKRSGIDERHIGEILGMTSLKAIRALCECDPVKMGDLIKRVI
ncbi:tyrosine-type recombinase/integrase [Shewanella algae]|uniref:site-specific integrase n=1 Tax=Shewanella algae TaxID=38313 RepID=UPI000B347691|nr:site-specific integrase [Shewanella putrefaciens]